MSGSSESEDDNDHVTEAQDRRCDVSRDEDSFQTAPLEQEPTLAEAAVGAVVKVDDEGVDADQDTGDQRGCGC